MHHYFDSESVELMHNPHVQSLLHPRVSLRQTHTQAFEEHTLHFIGLLSDGGVHSRYDQLLACLKGGNQAHHAGSVAVEAEYQGRCRASCAALLRGALCSTNRRPTSVVNSHMRAQRLQRRAPRGYESTRSQVLHSCSFQSVNGRIWLHGKMELNSLRPQFGASMKAVRMCLAHGSGPNPAFALTDGRDCEDGSSVRFVGQLQKDLADIEQAHQGCDAKIASGGGRMHVTMDRYEVRQRGLQLNQHVCGNSSSAHLSCSAPHRDGLKGPRGGW